MRFPSNRFASHYIIENVPESILALRGAAPLDFLTPHDGLRKLAVNVTSVILEIGASSLTDLSVSIQTKTTLPLSNASASKSMRHASSTDPGLIGDHQFTRQNRPRARK
ncbi:MAG TPA: hypothetical protein VH351_17150 [Bryobacteraceae bacterium]|jgi:hypothetical protein|nr:hypothetical protein [Bryobacteraceae bacterium]